MDDHSAYAFGRLEASGMNTPQEQLLPNDPQELVETHSKFFASQVDASEMYLSY